MTETNAFIAMAKASKAPAAKPAQATPRERAPRGLGNAPMRETVPRPDVAKSGVPRQVGSGERQLDGSRTPTFSQPVKKPGLAERQPAPKRSGGSGLEDAMGGLADQLHPRSRRRR